MTILSNSYSKTYAITQRSAIDLTLSENPLGASPKVIEVIIEAAGKSHLYPHEEKSLVSLIAKNHHIPENVILLGAGANQILEDFLKVFALGKSIVIPSATFPESAACMATLQGSVRSVLLKRDHSLNLSALLNACRADTGLIHLCNPNNPTGIWTEPSQLYQLADQSPVPILISEAGADFVKQTMIEHPMHSKIIVVRSFSKAYGLAGLRIGYSVASPEIILTMKRHLRSFQVNSIAIAAAKAALQDQEYLYKSIAYLLREKLWLMREMTALGFKTIPSQGQTFIAQIPKKFGTADYFCEAAKKYGVAVVNCSIYVGLNQYIRISPQKRQTNKKFVLILKKIMETK